MAGVEILQDFSSLRGVFHYGATVTFAEEPTIWREESAPGEQVFLVGGDLGGVIAEVVLDQPAFEGTGKFGGALAMGLGRGIMGQRSVGVEDGYGEV